MDGEREKRKKPELARPERASGKNRENATATRGKRRRAV